MTRPRTLRQRVVLAFCGMTAAACLLFGGLSFLFAYVVEDQIFAALLENEAAHLTGGAAQPRLPFVTLHRQWSEVPAEVREGGSPDAREVGGGEGRHYHVLRVALPEGDAWLVAEVSSLLVVRRLRGRLLSILIQATGIVLLGSLVIAALVASRSVRQLTSLVDAVERNRVSSAEVTDHEVRVLARALEDALARVETLLQREKAFVGDVSHELRTPVAVIRGAAELLERRELDPAAASQVRRIRDAAQSGEEIIELLLALAREETAEEERTSIPLLAVTEKLILRQSQLHEYGDAEVTLEIDPQTRVVAPRTAVEVVLSNLIVNALRHAGGAVVITGDESAVTVRDGGRGIETVGRRRGIGLNLVRRLCDVCGFTLNIESSENGTTATVTFV
jgi:signal transduction histidine kinase